MYNLLSKSDRIEIKIISIKVSKKNCKLIYFKIKQSIRHLLFNIKCVVHNKTISINDLSHLRNYFLNTVKDEADEVIIYR